ncbi:PREDICTED: 28S ribosomal protein S9, mitochondrial-like [Amphimedon queenslandica]|uniref:Ribosomal protein S9 n=1 Tax=Amphimedon queenslandica TaxID=400682 RepID=A0A1X7UG41_AMPQE|nr:PREDICTED: 28S ribosomal protein S9, mitochondrial-like [Amphimedon queenslandica]|eukprot:XP_019854305.1 PREDICTED: 28S ribosomal protein S9, mitochondrial-like [Amphimedon queenslandica]
MLPVLKRSIKSCREISSLLGAKFPSVSRFTTTEAEPPPNEELEAPPINAQPIVLEKTSPTEEELKNEEPWMQEEIIAYYRSKNILAKMMGRDPETFSQEDVQKAIRYLLPSSLFDKKARPFLKHPSEIYPKRIESSFDANNRPIEASFYSGSPCYDALVHKIYIEENKLDKRKARSESVPSQPLKWIEKDKLQNKIEEELTDEQYQDIINKLKPLAAHPDSHLISDFLDQYCKPVLDYRAKAKKYAISKCGYAHAMGHRKTAVAEVWLKKGTGEVTINNKPLQKYFGYITHRQQALYPLVLTKLLGQFDVKARVHGGGESGRAGAIRLGISRALLAFPGDHGELLEAENLLVRDPRRVERKKPGQKKARKKFAWVKR